MTDLRDLLAAIDSGHDAQYEARIRGRKITFFVRSPDHLTHLRHERQWLHLLDKIRGQQEAAQAVSEEDLTPVWAYMDKHVVALGETLWTDIEVASRSKILSSLSAADFWGLIHAIGSGGRLGEDEKNG